MYLFTTSEATFPSLSASSEQDLCQGLWYKITNTPSLRSRTIPKTFDIPQYLLPLQFWLPRQGPHAMGKISQKERLSDS